MTRSNLDRWEDCGEAPQSVLSVARSNVLDFSRLKSHARRFRHGTHSEVQGNLGRAHARTLHGRRKEYLKSYRYDLLSGEEE